MSDAPTSIDLSFSLKDKIAVVTGGASGIGRAIAQAYHDKGAKVALVDLKLDAAKAEAAAIGTDVLSYGCDVSDFASVQAAVAAIVADCGRIDILVNSAGIVALAPAEELTLDAWSMTINVNLSGSFFMAQTVGKVMLAAGYGRIINLASQAGSVALDQHVAYCTSKFGVIGLTKVLASEWAGRGVNCNCISPTVVLTELGKKAWEGPKGEALKQLIPTGRFAIPEEIAAAAVFLASGGADMINGADLLIDGGYTIR